jgi:hypothetical protein
LKDSDASYARRAEEKLKLAKQSHQLKMYQTLFVHESSTASQEEKALAEKNHEASSFRVLEMKRAVQPANMTMLAALSAELVRRRARFSRPLRLHYMKATPT